MKKLLLALSSLGLALLALSAQNAPNPGEEAARLKELAALVKAQGPSYPLDTCIISGKKLGSMGDPVEYNQDGRLVRLCCKGCTKTVAKDPASVLKKIDEAVVLAQRSIYPLDTCVVGGEKLGSMGTPVDYVAGTRLVRFCCPSCIDGFKQEPAKYMAKIDAALVEKLKATYAVDTCPISGHKLGEGGGTPVDKLYGVQLVRLCCEDCVAAFEKDPLAALAKVAEARKAKG